MKKPIPPETENSDPDGDTLHTGFLLKLDGWDVRSGALCVLLILALAYTIKLIKPVLLPILLAILLNFLLRPVFHRFRRVFRSYVLTSIVIMLAMIGTFFAGGYYLSEPAAEWMERLPDTIRHFPDG